jgi:dTDP-4-amino-4,6-dideoxygalactose transaminase
LPKQIDNQVSARHLYVVRLEQRYACYRSRVFESLREQGIGVNIHYIPVHTQPFYRDIGVDYSDLTAAEAYYATAITIPLHPSLSFEEQDFIVGVLKATLSEVTKGGLGL